MKYNDQQRQQAAKRIAEDMSKQLGEPIPPGFEESIIPALDDNDIGYALGEIQGKKHAKDWTTHSMRQAG